MMIYFVELHTADASDLIILPVAKQSEAVKRSDARIEQPSAAGSVDARDLRPSPNSSSCALNSGMYLIPLSMHRYSKKFCGHPLNWFELELKSEAV